MAYRNWSNLFNIVYSLFVLFYFIINQNKIRETKLLSIITMIILFWPIMSTGSLTKNWYGINIFYLVGICISIHKLKINNKYL